MDDYEKYLTNDNYTQFSQNHFGQCIVPENIHIPPQGRLTEISRGGSI